MNAGSHPAGLEFATAGDRHRAVDSVLAWRPSPQLLGVGALLAAIALSPRIPMPLPIPGRAFELRVEDVVLVVLLPIWVATRRQLGGALGRIPPAFGAYLAATLVSTAFGIAVIGLNPVRAMAYWGKAVELLLIALIVATWMRSRQERLAATLWLLALGLANAAWFAVQVLQPRRPSALFQVPYPAGVYVRPTQFESYGPGLIGEVSPLSTGAFMMLLFLLAFALFVQSANRRAALGYLAAAALFLAFTVDTVSRVSIAGALIGAAIIALALRRVRAGLAGFALCVVVTVAVANVADNPALNRFTNYRNIENSLTLRIQHSYEPVIAWLAPKRGATPAAVRRGPTPAPPGGTSTPGVGSSAPPTPVNGPLATPTAAPTATPLPQSSPARQVPGGVRDPDFRGRSLVVTAIGRGSGAMGTPGLLPTEAHNHFLRVFLESGLLGLVTFGGLLLSALWLLYRAVRRVGAAPLDRALAAAALAALAAFLVGALLQDMFLPVIPNEILWAMVGLAAATGLGVSRREPSP